MGFFGTYLYDGEHWHDADPDSRPTDDRPWMLLDIHDSDFTIVTYDPAPPGAGTAYLGITPRTYFEDPAASAPTDVFREAAGIAAWRSLLHPGGDQLATEEQIVTFLAQDVDPEDDDLDDGDLDDAEVFAEVKTARFVTALGLPLPPDLDT
ncbi:hypothetical protein [Paractinoplanes durhamensis]|uniref:Uncharacterized protein n=1 Tax=Paractinoplanes durhamensis TaxID=113563 RepID=A0ABQ3YQV7_9ACTN|nr:hypothetical protein [Actinoplanes durhamensis]GID99904.1 hypothetical protein Adu01nite_12550 [Actinoplanes durhamensis]